MGTFYSLPVKQKKEEGKVSGQHMDKSGVKRPLCQCVDATPYFPPDIEFNPEKSINCQSYSAALFVSLQKRGLLERALSSEKEYIALVDDKHIREPQKGQPLKREKMG